MKKNNQGQKLWMKAKKIIPGGNQLLSKRAELFLPNYWPAYYSRANGCEVWDLDENHYFDFAGMGVSSCTLGYSNDKVDNAVKKAISDGSMSTLNSYEEVELAQMLINLHPWSDQIRFARTGGEACAIAIRIARAASGKDNIAFCGYHGWHDWYLSSNLKNENGLDKQLLPGLAPLGVPKNLSNTTFPFNYNDVSSFNNAIKNNNVGVIIMEPVRGMEPDSGFLELIRSKANEIGAVLIFDEVTSGFRLNLGGLHLKYKVNPDLLVLGKALGNGYPISSILGIKNIMDVAQDSFISSTMWTERTGFAASLATLKEMKRLKSQKILIERGRILKTIWKTNANNNNLKINIFGIDAIPNFSFDYKNNLAMQTYFIQEMLKLGFLTRTGTAMCIAHTPKIIDKYSDAVSTVFRDLKKLHENNKIESALMGPVKHSKFERLN